MSFIRHESDVPAVCAKMFGGEGEIEQHKLLLAPEEMLGKGRLFNRNVINPGCELGWHVHSGDCETYYILSGSGEYSDNGNIVKVGPGDITFVNSGEGHSIKNTGDVPIDIIALILYV